MNSRLIKAAILGFLIAVLGLVISLLPFGTDLEENVGLDLLFHLRGPRQVPSDVVVISIDKESADNLNLPSDPRKWPRSLHARLIENLRKEGAAVIAFDLIFNEPRPLKDDTAFINSIHNARNVVLCEYLKIEEVPLTDERGKPKGDLSIVKVVPPIPPIAQSAVALAPFPLPKVPVRVSQYWTFKTIAGGMPTLPVVVFQIFTMKTYGEFLHLLGKVSPGHAEKLPHDTNAILDTKNVERLIQTIRGIFKTEPLTAERMLKELQNSKTLSVDVKEHQMIRSLIKMYQKSTNSQFLNFYGPPRTITTIPYYKVLGNSFNKNQFNLRDKVVFIGLSALSPAEQNEGFYTVFSEQGLDISGVEIAATAFANLLEDMPVRPINLPMQIAVIILWGMMLGIVCRRFTTIIAALSVIGLSVLYLIAAEYQFKTTGKWYPVTFPLFFQVPLTFFGAVIWNYIDAKKESKSIRKVFEYYLPNDVIDKLSKDIAHIKTTSQIVYGICLYTDAEQYTALSETLDPGELGRFMNRYYETVFKPIKQHGGTMSNVIGDSLLALWVAVNPEPIIKYNACSAALDIASAIQQFNRGLDTIQLQTRISLHSGRILLGNIGAIDHYEYRPIGDIVNTATRIDGLNKHLGTQILVTEDVIKQLDGFLTREIGEFLLFGKSKPLVVYELLCRIEECSDQQRVACAVFVEGLDAFRRQSWDGAIEKFNKYLEYFGEDGPSHFYVKLCKQYKESPPMDSWNGIVQMDKK